MTNGKGKPVRHPSSARRGARSMTFDRAETIAAEALRHLADEPALLEEFLGTTGLTPAELCSLVEDRGFLSAVLAHLAQDEPLLLAFATQRGFAPEEVMAALHMLEGPPHGRDHA